MRVELIPPGRAGLVALGLTLGVTLPSANAAAVEQVLVWTVTAVSPEQGGLATWLRTDLEMHVRRLSGFATLPREPVAAVVAAEYPDLVDCVAEPNCLAEIGVIAAADLVLVATMAKLGDNWSVSLRAVRTEKRTATVANTDRVSGAEEAISAAVAQLLPRLLAPPVEVLPEVQPVAGETGMGPWGITAWGTAGAAALAGAGAGTFGILTLHTRSQQEELCPDRRCATDSALERARALARDGRQERAWANALLIVTGALASAAATFFFVDAGTDD
jgi:hypothetical protein